jgi:hypothetical protein
MSVGIYDQMFQYVNGALLAENTTVKLALEGTEVDVMTIVKGFAGQTPGPTKVTASCENVIPVSGFEVNTWNMQLNSEIVEMKFQFGGSGISLTSEGFIRGNVIDAGVSATSGITFEFHGGPGEWS